MCICRMALCLYAGCHFCFEQKPMKMHCVCICRMPFCLYAGSYFCKTKAMKVHCVYMPESPGVPRRAKENPGYFRRAQESSAEPRKAQEGPGEPSSAWENSGETRRAQERPGEPRRAILTCPLWRHLQFAEFNCIGIRIFKVLKTLRTLL